MRRISAFVLAVALSLGTVASAAAATVTESFDVLSAMSCSGIPASLPTYGNLTPGVPSAAQTISLSCDSNVAWKVYVSGTDFTGPATVAKSARQLQVANESAGTNNYPSWTAFSATPFTAWEGAAGSGFTADLQLRVTVGTSTPPGSYTGSIDVSIGT